MFVVKLHEISAIHIVQHSYVAAKTITSPTLLPIYEHRIVTIIYHTVILSRLATQIESFLAALFANKVGVISSKLWIRQFRPADAA